MAKQSDNRPDQEGQNTASASPRFPRPGKRPWRRPWRTEPMRSEKDVRLVLILLVVCWIVAFGALIGGVLLAR